MKRICALLIMGILVSMACCALAAAKTYELGEMRNGYFVCEDFEEEMTQKAAEVFSELLRDGDRCSAARCLKSIFAISRTG